MRITNINHITLACVDLERSFGFYKDVLEFTPLVKWDKGAYFLVGNFWFCLNVDLASHPSSDCTHYAWSVSAEDFQSLCEKIIQSGATVFKENTSPGDSLYFLDPDGHKLEIHVGNHQTRIEAKKAEIGTWKNVEWFV